MDAQRVASEFVELEIELRDGEPSGLGGIAKELERAGAQASDQTPKLFRVLALEPRARAKTPFESSAGGCASSSTRSSRTIPGPASARTPRAFTTCASPSDAREPCSAPAAAVASDTQLLSLELQWLGSVLGDVRDLDVLLGRLRDEAATLDAGRSRRGRQAAAHARAAADACTADDAEGARRPALRHPAGPLRRRAHDARAEQQQAHAGDPGTARAQATSARRAGARPGTRRTTRCTLCGSEASGCVMHTSFPARRRSSSAPRNFRTCSASIKTRSSPRNASARCRWTLRQTRRSRQDC